MKTAYSLCMTHHCIEKGSMGIAIRPQVLSDELANSLRAKCKKVSRKRREDL